MLAKFVFVALEYTGWTGLSAHDLHEKAEPFKFAVREHWKRLKRSDPDLMSTLKPFVKTKWCDTANRNIKRKKSLISPWGEEEKEERKGEGRIRGK